MERLKPLFSISCLLVAVGNVIDGIVGGHSIPWFLGYVGVPILISAAFFFFASKISLKIITYILYLMALFSIAMGTRGNLSAPFYLCMGFHIYENTKLFKCTLILVAIAILLKAVLSPFTISQTYKYLVGILFGMALWHTILVHPKRLKAKKFTEDDYEDIHIVQYVTDGLSYKEIGDLLDLSTSAISKRLERFRGRMNAKSNEELAVLLSRSGQIVLKSDR